MSIRRPTAIEIFSGAGGTSFGFQAAGYDVRLGLDIDPSAIATFSRNHGNAVALTSPIEEVKGSDLLSKAGIDELDMLIGGPSCQGYSTIGKRIQDDPRNFLFTHYIRIVKETNPKWIVFENVKGMLFYGKGMFLKELRESLNSLGYKTAYAVLNAADYGVPQMRERLIVIGTRLDIEPSLPSPTHEDPRCRICSRPNGAKKRPTSAQAPGLFGGIVCLSCNDTGLEPRANLRLLPWVTAWDAIGDLPVLGDTGGSDELVPYETDAFSDYQLMMRSGATGYTHHKARPVSAYAKSLISKIPEGKGIRAIPEEELPERFQTMRRVSDGSLRRDCTTLYHRLSRTLPSYTITCYFGNVSSGAFTHPLVDRAITIREAARLQSFPDAFSFVSKDIRRQIGNAVPPILAQRIGEHIRTCWEGAIPVTTESPEGLPLSV